MLSQVILPQWAQWIADIWYESTHHIGSRHTRSCGLSDNGPGDRLHYVRALLIWINRIYKPMGQRGGRWWPGANRRQAINDHHADFWMISVRSIISCNIWFASGQRGGRWWPGAKKHQAISDHHASMTYEWLASEVSYPEGYMIRIGSLTSIKQSIFERGDPVHFITNTKLFVIGPDIRPVLSTKYLHWP